MIRWEAWVCLLAACSASQVACEEELHADGHGYCLILDPIVIEGGFDCPPEYATRIDGPAGVVCTDSMATSPTELPAEACTAVGYDPALCEPPDAALECSGRLTVVERDGSEFAFCDGFAEAEGATFERARENCRAWGGDYPRGLDAEDWVFVGANMETDFFFGVSDEAEEGVWRWIADDTEASFQPWIESHPLGGRGSNFALARADFDFRWSDAGFSRRAGFVCER